MWELYLVGAEMDFRHMYTMNFQIQLCKDINAVPLTSDYMFEGEQQHSQKIPAKEKKAA